MILSAVIAIVISGPWPVWASSNAIVNTTSGLTLGFVNNTTPHVTQFLGIPFAEPPVGSLRWLPSSRKSREQETIVADHFGPACPQFLNDVRTAPNIFTVDVPEFNIYPEDYQAEDCLSLSVWSPTRAIQVNPKQHLLPVIIWIYGGAFYNGGTNIPYQNPAPWVERSKRHIVVSINHRLNILGFPNAAGLPPDQQNLGLLDQRIAIEWIRDNIAGFGGDPKRLILMGQSTGAMSADYYNFAYPDDPIIAGYIMHSGTALLPFDNPDVTQGGFSLVAKYFSCSNPVPHLEVECLRKVGASDLIAFIKGYSDNGTQPGLTFVANTDDRTKFANYTSRALSGRYSKKPALIGTTTNEGAVFLPYNPVSGPDQVAADVLTTGVFLCPSVKTSQDRDASNAQTFRYVYAGNFSNISPRWWQGAYHGADLPLVFGTYGIARGAGSRFQRKVSERMQDYWLAFAEDPEHGLPLMGWTSRQEGKRKVLVIGEDNTVARFAIEDETKLGCTL